jgi:simple sugar transport system permease protein
MNPPRPNRELTRLLILTLLLFGVMAALNPDRFLTGRNFQSMAFQFPELGLLALAVMIPLITAGIDLSIVSIANLAGIMAALVLTSGTSATSEAALPRVFAALLVAIATGALCGAGNGLLVGRLGLTPILATLGTLQLFMGLAFVITKGPAISGFHESFLWLGNAHPFGLPVPVLLFGTVALATALLLSRSRFGLQLYLLGANVTAADYAGFNRPSLLFRTYLYSGIVSGLAGLLMIARTNSAKADYGTSYLLQAILVAILGGVNPNGGAGSVTGVVLALLSLQFISSGFSSLRLSQFTQEFAWGALLLLVMGLNALAQREHHRTRQRSPALVSSNVSNNRPSIS